MVIEYLLKIKTDNDDYIIKYQTYENNKKISITDLEITDNQNYYVIIEAKYGWHLPGKEQIEKYSLRKDFICNPAKKKKIVSMSECSNEYAEKKLAKIPGVLVKHLSWDKLLELSICAERNTRKHKEKNILKDFRRYINNIMNADNKKTNEVFVVPLGKKEVRLKTTSGDMIVSDLTTVDIKEKYNKYFWVYGAKNYPKNPPTYFAFRYNRKLQSINYVEKCDITNNLHKYIPDIPDEDLLDEYYVFDLGPYIIPSKDVFAGDKIRDTRYWIDIDLLLTSATIVEAKKLSDARKKNK